MSTTTPAGAAGSDSGPHFGSRHIEDVEVRRVFLQCDVYGHVHRAARRRRRQAKCPHERVTQLFESRWSNVPLDELPHCLGLDRSSVNPLDPRPAPRRISRPGASDDHNRHLVAAQRHMYEFGTKAEDLAEIAVAARAWALLNPVAHRYGAGPLTVETVLDSPMISSPLHRLDCCLVTDGGGAVVVTSRERGRDLRPTPIRVLGRDEHSTHVAMSQMPDLTSTGAVTSGKRAFEAAGLRPDDIDVVEIYDSFTITTLLTLEALGFAGRGEGAGLVPDGGIGPGGSLPVNTSGGGLSYCHPGMFGIFLIIEAVRQLRGEAGLRQVDGAEMALVHGTGGILTSHATAILGRDR